MFCISLGNGSCVECNSTKVGLLIGLIIVAWVYVIILHQVAQSSSADVKIFIYFIQTAVFQIGTFKYI